MPYAGSDYQFYRNVLDFGAKGDGVTDDTIAINRAVAWSSTTNSTLRCGEACGSTSTLGALVYFPVRLLVLEGCWLSHKYSLLP